MKSLLSRRSFLTGLGAASIGGAGWAGAPEMSPRPNARPEDFQRYAAGGVQGLIDRYGLSGQVVCSVADVKTGLQLEAAEGTAQMPPASVAKALTALYALDVLGETYRFETRLMGTGPIADGVLKGDLILVGGGDPTLDTDGLAELAAYLKASGVKSVQGGFKVYDGLFPYVRSIDEGQPDHLGYSPSVSGIALNFNRVHFEWKRAGKGYSVAMDARSDKYRPDVTMAKMRVADRRLPIYSYADKNGIDNWSVAGPALGKGGSRWLPVRKPAAYAGDVMRTMARAQGIKLSKAETIRELPAGLTPITSVFSEPLPDVLRDMLKFSTNLTAEMVGLAATVALGDNPKTLAESASRMNQWAGASLGMAQTRMVDHSGLGDQSRMTPDDLVGALIQVRKQGRLRPLLKPVKMRDAKGKVIKDHPILVDAKTGTLNFVSGLGGYMTAQDGTELAFAIFAADVDRRAQIAKADREIPQGAGKWNRKAKQLQQRLIERWGAVYGT